MNVSLRKRALQTCYTSSASIAHGPFFLSKVIVFIRILPDQPYSQFMLDKFGKVGKRAFSSSRRNALLKYYDAASM